MNKKEQLQMDTLRAQLKAEQEYSQRQAEIHRKTFYSLVDCEIKLERIRKIMQGEE